MTALHKLVKNWGKHFNIPGNAYQVAFIFYKTGRRNWGGKACHSSPYGDGVRIIDAVQESIGLQRDYLID
jgi:hypothetical protein